MWLQPSFLGFPMNRLAVDGDPLSDICYVAIFFVLFGLLVVLRLKVWLKRPNKERGGAGESAIDRFCEERKIQTRNWVGSDKKSGIGRRATKAIGDQGVTRGFIKLSKESRLGEFLFGVLTFLLWICIIWNDWKAWSLPFLSFFHVSRFF